MILAQEGNADQGVIIGGAFSAIQLPPSAPMGELWLVHSSGCFLKMQNDGTIQISGDVHVNGDVYDRYGALSSLRAHYNEHVHSDSRGGMTTPPVPQD